MPPRNYTKPAVLQHIHLWIDKGFCETNSHRIDVLHLLQLAKHVPYCTLPRREHSGHLASAGEISVTSLRHPAPKMWPPKHHGILHRDLLCDLLTFLGRAASGNSYSTSIFQRNLAIASSVSLKKLLCILQCTCKPCHCHQVHMMPPVNSNMSKCQCLFLSMTRVKWKIRMIALGGRNWYWKLCTGVQA